MQNLTIHIMIMTLMTHQKTASCRRLLNSLDHPNIVSYYQFFQTTQALWPQQLSVSLASAFFQGLLRPNPGYLSNLLIKSHQISSTHLRLIFRRYPLQLFWYWWCGMMTERRCLEPVAIPRYIVMSRCQGPDLMEHVEAKEQHNVQISLFAIWYSDFQCELVHLW